MGVEKIKIKDHLSPAKAEIRAELGNYDIGVHSADDPAL